MHCMLISLKVLKVSLLLVLQKNFSVTFPQCFRKAYIFGDL